MAGCVVEAAVVAPPLPRLHSTQEWLCGVAFVESGFVTGDKITAPMSARPVHAWTGQTSLVFASVHRVRRHAFLRRARRNLGTGPVP